MDGKSKSRHSAVWTEEEILWLKNNYPAKGRNFCASYLNRSEGSIRSRASIMGLSMDPNPKGMLGKKHSEETLDILSQRSIEKWKDPNFILNQEDYRQNVSDRMTLVMASGDKRYRRGYSRGKQGKRDDLNNQYFRSSWEANYARYLNFLLKHNEIYKWEFEPDTFIFEAIKRGTRSYLPDFKIWETSDSQPYYVEIKGWMDAKSKTKLDRMEKYFPQIKIILLQKKEYHAIQRAVGRLIKNWE